MKWAGGGAQSSGGGEHRPRSTVLFLSRCTPPLYPTICDRGEYLSKKSETVYRPIWGIMKLLFSEHRRRTTFVFSLTHSSTLSHYVRPTVIVYMYASMRNIYAFQWALSSEHLWFFSHAALLTSTPQPTSKIWDVVSVNLLATSLSAFNSPRERSFSTSLESRVKFARLCYWHNLDLKPELGFQSFNSLTILR